MALSCTSDRDQLALVSPLADAEGAVPDASEAFDAIFSMEVFYYVADLSQALAEVARILKPGGLFACVVDFYRENPDSHSWPEDVGVSMRLLSAEEWKEAMTEAGLNVVEQCFLTDATETTSVSSAPCAGSSLMTLVRRSQAPTSQTA